MKGLFGLLLPVLAAATPAFIGTIHREAAPILSSTNAQEVPDSYIVVFKKHTTVPTAAAHHMWVQRLHQTSLKKRQFPFQGGVLSGLKHTFDFGGALLGYTGHFDNEVIEQVRRHPDVSAQKQVVVLCLHVYCRSTTSRRTRKSISLGMKKRPLRKTRPGVLLEYPTGTA